MNLPPIFSGGIKRLLVSICLLPEFLLAYPIIHSSCGPYARLHGPPLVTPPLAAAAAAAFLMQYRHQLLFYFLLVQPTSTPDSH